ncbi:MAG TPA: M1 family metallopeptidase [Acidimicrobiales bacterium]
MPSSTSSSSSGSDLTPFRLPRSVEPVTYRIELEPDLGAATFSGTAEIDVLVHEEIEQIVLNAADLAISDVAVRPEGKTAFSCAVTFDDDLEQVSFQPSEKLPLGPSTVSCRFTGTLNDQLRGFYRSTFTDEAGQTHTIATTQLESVDARRAFPCWDEPDRKAVFEITLIVDRDLESYSNSPIVSVQREGDKNRVTFSPTMKMSTYLVAFIVGNFETTETVDVDGIPLRIVFPPGKRGLADFALAIGAFGLRFFAEYFDIPYPGDKVDLIAIPDFAAGAMENLGCITFRDTALLVDPSKSSRAEMERVADVVAHELAHMWFGDLVTMGWWEGIWLNEAFATFMEMLCVDAFRPSWDRWIGFAASREAALTIDGVHSTRPIEYPVGPPKEAEGMFDLLTYEKGASVLRMLEQHIGPEVFRDGVRRYLKRHAYANTVTNDLWDALEEASGAPVRNVMDTFILQGGHPLVTLTGDTIDQQPFAYGPVPDGTTSSIGSNWNVPVAVRSLAESDKPANKYVLGTTPQKVADTSPGPAVINAGGWGVFRVGYASEQRLALADRLPELTPLERANLLADTWATTLAGHSSLTEFLVLAAKLGLEDDPAPWQPVFSALMLINRIVAESERHDFQAAVTALFGPKYAQLGFETQPGEGERTPTLRSLAINAMGTVGADPEVRAEAARRFDASPIAGGDVPIPADVEAATLVVVTNQVRPGDYESLLQRYRNAATPQEEIRTLSALTTFPDPDLALNTFDLGMTEVRTQNGFLVFGGLLANPVAGQAIWQRITESWDQMLARLPKNSHTRVVESIPGLCGDAGFAARVVGFLDEHPMASGPRRVAQSIEKLSINLAFADRERDGLTDAFQAAVDAAQTS